MLTWRSQYNPQKKTKARKVQRPNETNEYAALKLSGQRIPGSVINSHCLRKQKVKEKQNIFRIIERQELKQ